MYTHNIKYYWGDRRSGKTTKSFIDILTHAVYDRGDSILCCTNHLRLRYSQNKLMNIIQAMGLNIAVANKQFIEIENPLGENYTIYFCIERNLSEFMNRRGINIRKSFIAFDIA